MSTLLSSLTSTLRVIWPSVAVTGPILFVMCLLALLNTFQLASTAELATVLACVFVLLELPRLKPGQRKQIGMLAGIGFAFALWAWFQGSDLALLDLLGEHLKLVMLLTAVNFISLATRLERSGERRGLGSFSFTLAGMHLFSAIANFSSVIMVGDQVKRNERVDALSQMILSRGFGLAVLWSPFLSILALVLEQVPGAELYRIYPFSISLALLGLLLCVVDARLRFPRSLAGYEGYPLKASTLTLPVVMMACVLLMTALYPVLPTVAVVSCVAILAPLALVSLRQGPVSGVGTLGRHITTKLADARAEISLFLAAGILAGGVKACIGVGLIALPFTETNALVASVVLCAVVFLAHIGLHQLAVVAIFAGLLADVTTTPTLMAVAYLLATALSMSGSTFSGLSFILQARFYTQPRDILSVNLPFTLAMLVAGCGILFLMEALGVS